jgi:Ran GTPase-activating protein (RanGAP) involved in mRNA processing and transport
VPEEITDQLRAEIDEYLDEVMKNKDPIIMMANHEIRSPGANSVAAAINFCANLTEVKLSNCGIRDPGAKTLFKEAASSNSLMVLDLSDNPITERSFNALEDLLTTNQTLQTVVLKNI